MVVVQITTSTKTVLVRNLVFTVVIGGKRLVVTWPEHKTAAADQRQRRIVPPVSVPTSVWCGIIRSFSCPAVLDRPQPTDARTRRPMNRRGLDLDQQASGPVSATGEACLRLPG